MIDPSIIIVHYHLRQGGVTQVIRTTSKALSEVGVPHLIFCGDPGDESDDLPVVALEGLDYSTGSEGNVERLAQRMIDSARTRFPSGRIVWHVHNPVLGKNPIVSKAISLLAQRGESLLLHHHDLAEDGRSAQLGALSDFDQLYPFSSRVIHGFINSRDHARFHTAGLPPEFGVNLGNPVTPLPRLALSDASDPLVFQPVRAIRRKNLGETILLAASAPPGARFAVSRAPIQPEWKPIYEGWRRFVEDAELPVDLDVSADGSFAGFLQRSTHLLTTSVAEGFGLPHLDALQIGRPLIGREIPHLRPDLPRPGDDRLYRALRVPCDWIDLEALLTQTADALSCHRYPSDDAAITAALGGGNAPDFGRLPEGFQQEIIRKVQAGYRGIVAEFETHSMPLDHWLAERLNDRQPSGGPCDLASFEARNHALKLRNLYLRLADAAPADPAFLNRQAVLKEFRNPADFHFLHA